MSLEDYVSKSNKVDKPLSILLSLDRLKAYYVEASIENIPLVFVCVPRSQARSFIQVGMPDSMVSTMLKGAGNSGL